MSSNTVDFSEAQVHKRYRSRIAHDNELLFLTALAQSGLTPKILSQTQDSITLAAIKGHTLLEALEAVWLGQAPPEESRRLLGLLVRWLCEAQRHFTKETGRIAALEDPNLRNFLVVPSGGLVGLDFECWHDGTSEETPAMLLAYLSLYRGAELPAARKDTSWFRESLVRSLALEEANLLRAEERCQTRLLRRRATTALRRDSTAVILTGGRSERMGRPKAELEIGGYTFLERMLYALSSFDQVAVSASETYRPDTTAPVWLDSRSGIGPMGGLLTALSRAQTPLVFLTACDTPDITEDFIYYLYNALSPEDDCLVPVAEGRLQPLMGIYRTSLLPRVEALVQSGNYRMRALLDSASTHYLPLPPPLSAQSVNINTPQEYAAWQARKAEQGEQAHENR